jgi:hypothetical protein
MRYRGVCVCVARSCYCGVSSPLARRSRLVPPPPLGPGSDELRYIPPSPAPRDWYESSNEDLLVLCWEEYTSGICDGAAVYSDGSSVADADIARDMALAARGRNKWCGACRWRYVSLRTGVLCCCVCMFLSLPAAHPSRCLGYNARCESHRSLLFYIYIVT